MVMTCHHALSTAHLILLVLLIVTPQLAGTAPVWGEGGEGGEGGVEGRTRTDHKGDSLAPLLSPPPQSLSSPDNRSLDQGRGLGQDNQSDKATNTAQVLAVLLEALDHPEEGKILVSRNRDWEEDQHHELPSIEGLEGREIRRTGQAEGERGVAEEKEGQGADKAIEQLIVGHLTAAQGDDLKHNKNSRSEEYRGWSMEDAGPGSVSVEGGKEEEERHEEGNDLESFIDKARPSSTSQGDESSLQRKIRGYFQNIDLGLQDNEILPPLKGYKAYNTQLARAGKKLHWQENQSRNRPIKGGNFMDDFENEGEELEEEFEEEEESLSQMEEEARARAEKQEVLRQQEEAERAREEEQRLADIASDMLLQYMGRKQQSYMKPRQKSSMGGAEDKRSEEVLPDEDDLDQQMIDRLIEISSKLHLPADDVIEIISDVEEKKKKRKEQQPVPRLPLTPYISNYILPHPRTYQPLPPPKPITTPRRGRQPPYYYQQVTPGDDYEEDGLVPQLDSEEELENFIERIYMKRRMY
uniref:Si:dkey-175g6.2 n=1 Tax=Mastacembelus armatus TaxID=205130 RepID=A0A3Q3MWW0_9TELE